MITIFKLLSCVFSDDAYYMCVVISQHLIRLILNPSQLSQLLFSLLYSPCRYTSLPLTTTAPPSFSPPLLWSHWFSQSPPLVLTTTIISCASLCHPFLNPNVIYWQCGYWFLHFDLHHHRHAQLLTCIGELVNSIIKRLLV